LTRQRIRSLWRPRMLAWPSGFRINPTCTCALYISLALCCFARSIYQRRTISGPLSTLIAPMIPDVTATLYESSVQTSRMKRAESKPAPEGDPIIGRSLPMTSSVTGEGGRRRGRQPSLTDAPPDAPRWSFWTWTRAADDEDVGADKGFLLEAARSGCVAGRVRAVHAKDRRPWHRRRR